MNRKKTLLSLSIMTASLGFSQAAQASDWGCEVLLCLSDPRGPTTENECRPPIEKLWKELAKGNPFPSCELADDSKSGKGSFARQVYEHYDPCPNGTIPVLGAYVTQSNSTSSRDWQRSQYQWASRGVARMGSDEPSDIGARACVGKQIGTYSVRPGGGAGDSPEYISVQVYDAITWQQPKNPRAIDVYIDGALHQRVRY